MFYPLALALLLPATVGCQPATTDHELHQGTWSVLESVRDGVTAPPDLLESIQRVVEGDRIVWSRDGRSFAATRFELNPESTPKELILIPEGGRNRDQRIKAIYKFEGNRLTICTADPDEPFPTAFEAKAGSKVTLMVFKRVTPEPGSW